MKTTAHGGDPRCPDHLFFPSPWIRWCWPSTVPICQGAAQYRPQSVPLPGHGRAGDAIGGRAGFEVSGRWRLLVNWRPFFALWVFEGCRNRLVQRILAIKPWPRPRRKPWSPVSSIRWQPSMIDERSDVVRHSPPCGSASPSTVPACARARRCWIWPAVPAIRPPSFSRIVGETGQVVLADINDSMLKGGSRQAAQPGGPTMSPMCRPMPRRSPSGQPLRRHHHRLRPSQRHRQGQGARLHVPGAQSRAVPSAGAGVLQAGAK